MSAAGEVSIHGRRRRNSCVSGERTGLDGAALATASRLVAKVDSAAVQDGYDLYLHGFILADDGKWVVVQQGMNGDTRYARRYHWQSEGLKSFVEAPHAAIDGENEGRDHQSHRSQGGGIPFGPARPAARPRAGPHRPRGGRARPADRPPPETPLLPHLVMPAHHDVRSKDVILRRLHGALAAAADRGPSDFADLLLAPGVGARTVRSLAMVAEVVHGAPYRFADPARFSLAHGGKDRQPYPVPTKVYDQTIALLKSAVDKARLGNEERLQAIRRLDDQARRLERTATGPTFSQIVETERRRSHDYGGRSVFGWEPRELGFLSEVL